MTQRGMASRLRWAISLIAIAVLVPGGWLAARQTLADVNALCDARLAQAASSLDAIITQVGVTQFTSGAAAARSMPDVPVDGSPGEAPTHEVEVGYHVADATGRVVLATDNLRDLPPPPTERSSFRDLRLDRRAWRIYTFRDTAHGLTVSAGERYDSRRDVLRALWLEHALPLLIGVPLLAVAVRWSVSRALSPLATLAKLLALRRPGSRAPLVLAAAPAEIQPIVAALNDQFARLEHAVERERRFSADVAHELRTPLASTMINIDSAMDVRSSTHATVALSEAYASLQSLMRRTDQLLLLARLDDADAVPRGRIDVGASALEVVEELQSTREPGHATLHLDLPLLPVWMVAHGPALGALMRNLVENALRHAPGDGHVTLAVRQEADGVVIDVTDDGPGIPADRREAVFQRFHREATSLGDGFGLGLSIVQRVAQLHGAQVALLDGPSERGLCVRVSLPHRLR